MTMEKFFASKITIPCLSASAWVETKELMAGYVILDTDAKTPAAHIILER